MLGENTIYANNKEIPLLYLEDTMNKGHILRGFDLSDKNISHLYEINFGSVNKSEPFA